MRAEQLSLDYEKQQENAEDKRLKSIIENRLKGKNKDRKLGFDFIHGVNAEFSIFGEKKTIRNELTPPMQKEWDLEIFKKTMKIAAESGFVFTGGVEDEVRKLEIEVEKRKKSKWSSIEDSLPEGDR